MAFSSARSGVQEIWTCQPDGSSPKQLTRLGGPVSATPRWSPDGSQIVFDSDHTGVYQIYMTTVEGGKPKRLTEGPGTNFGANWAPDGKWLYFTSNRSGELNIWKMAATSGTAEQVTRNGGNMPTLSPDGKFLFYAKSNNLSESSMWRLPLSSAGSGAQATMLVDRFHRFSYAVTEPGVYFSVPQPERAVGTTIEYLNLATAKRSIVARTDKAPDTGLAISPDRRSLLYCQIDSQGSNLMILENFR